MTRWHPVTKLLVLLAFPILGWLVWTMGGGSEVAQVRRAETPGIEVDNLDIDVVQRRALPGLQTFAAVVERPLFTPSRRLVRPLEPVAEPEPEGEDEPVAEVQPSVERPDLRLFGTVQQRGRATALVTRESGGSMEQLAVDATVEGWRVAEVTRDRLVLTLDDRQEVYSIFEPANNAGADEAAGGETVEEGAEEANGTPEEAGEAVDEADETADEADGTADEADGTADEADGTADEAGEATDEAVDEQE
jgi:hypothetical protein